MAHPYQLVRQSRTNGSGGSASKSKPTARVENRMQIPQRITWTEVEWRAVVEQAIKIQEAEPNLSDYQAADRAQAIALLTHRQRPFYSSAGNPQSSLREGLAPYFAQMRAEQASKALETTMHDGAVIDAQDETKPATAQEQASLALIDDAAPSSTEQPTTLDYGALAAEREAPNTQHADYHHAQPRTLVRWNDEEKMVIAKKSLALMRGFDGMKPLEAIRKAVEYELSADRQRTIATFGEVKWIDALWKLIQDSEQAEALAREKQQEQEARERQQREHEEEQREIEARAEREREEAERIAAEKAAARELSIEEAVNERLAGMTFEGIVRLFANKVARTVMNEIGASLYADIEEQIEGLMTAARAGIPTPSAAGAAQIEVPTTIKRPAHRPKVLICGLLNQQIAEIKHSYGDVLDLDFAKHREEGGTRLKDKGARDLVLIMDEWGGARFKREAKAAGVQFVPINGTVSALKKWLDSYVSSANGA